jgi:hypothetical protein
MIKQLYLLIAALCLLSCGTLRKTTVSNIRHEEVDTTAQEATDSQEHSHSSETKDSTIGLSAKSVQDSVGSVLTELAINAKKTPIYKERTINGLKAWVLIDTSGKIHFGANCDSITLVVKGIIRERDSFKGLYHKETFERTVINDESSVTKTIVKEPWWIANWYWILAGVVAALLVLDNYFPVFNWILKLFKRNN